MTLSKLETQIEEFVTGLRCEERWQEQELSVLQNAILGKAISFGGGGELLPHQKRRTRWHSQESRKIRASFIEWVVFDLPKEHPVHPKGLRIENALITDDLDLSFASIDYPIEFNDCEFSGRDVKLDHARTGRMSFKGSGLGKLHASGLKCDGDLLLGEGFEATDEVRLRNLEIDGDLVFSGGTFKGCGENAITLLQPDVSGCILFGRKNEVDRDDATRFTADATVRIENGKIGGNLAFSGGSTITGENIALILDGLDVKGDVILGSERYPENEHCADCCENSAYEFVTYGCVRILCATIGGDLKCSNAYFEQPKHFGVRDKCALRIDGIETKGDVFLDRGFSCKGGVRLEHAKIAGDLRMSGATLQPPMRGETKLVVDEDRGPIALEIEGVTCAGSILLDECRKTMQDGGQGRASTNDDDQKGRGTPFHATGAVLISGTTINGRLKCDCAVFENPGNVAFEMVNTSVTGRLWWTLEKPPKGECRFIHSTVGQLHDRKQGWPQAGALRLDRFRYGSISEGSPPSADDRIKWLTGVYPKKWWQKLCFLKRGQKVEAAHDAENKASATGAENNSRSNTDRKSIEFSTQPYEQLYEVFRRSGKLEDAKKIAIAERWQSIKTGRNGSNWGFRSIARWLVYISLYVTTGFGYRPWRLVICFSFLVVIGWCVFSLGKLDDPKIDGKPFLQTTIVAKADQEFIRFNPLVYSFDVALPFVDLRQQSAWIPNPHWECEKQLALRLFGWEPGGCGWILANAVRVLTVLGWLFATLVIAALTGIVKRV